MLKYPISVLPRNYELGMKCFQTTVQLKCRVTIAHVSHVFVMHTASSEKDVEVI